PACTNGGQRLYFPEGTYLFTDSIDLTPFYEISLVGDVDVDGNPSTILKADSIATPKANNSKNMPVGTPVVYYHPVIVKDGNTVYNLTGGSALHMRNIEVDGPLSQNGVAVFIQGVVDNDFNNDVFRGFIGLWGGDAMFSGAVRD